MSLNALFSSMKKTGIVKQLDQHLLKMSALEGDADRKNVTNSPSSALGCSRANYYQRLGETKEIIEPRVRRIFDNGHGMHERIQGYLTDMGLLLMDEVPLINEEYEIQGHTDGLLKLEPKKNHIKVLEIKSINSRGFSGLKEAKVVHKAQAMVYIFTLEERRKYLKRKYPTLKEFRKSALKRRLYFASKYQHLKEGSKYTRAEKIRFKVNQHMKSDELLYSLVKPINEAIILYECKDTQELKEFEVSLDKELVAEVLGKYETNNVAWRAKQIPERECRNKSDGRWCDFVNTCFE